MEGGSSSSSGEAQIKSFRPIDMPSTSRAHYEESPPTPKEHFHRSDSVPRLEDLIAGDSRLEELYNGDPAPSKQTVHEEDDNEETDEMRHGDDFNPLVRCCPQGHSLGFLAEPPYSIGKFFCNGCREDISGPVYHCQLCKFDLCPSCASTSSSTSTSGAISHPLPVIDSTITPWPSDVQETSETSPPLLNCGNVFHSLELLPCPPYPGGAYNCDLCLKEGHGQHYHCTSCRDFDLHPACARITTEIKSFAHPHGLVLQPPYSRGSNAMCDGCLECLGGSQWVYRCSVGCDFDLHALCSKLAQKICHPLHPEHELDLTILQNIRASNNVTCDGCECRIDPSELVYYCDDCEFGLHPLCAIGDDLLRS